MRCLSVLDLVSLFYLFIIFLGREAQKVSSKGPRMGRQLFKNVDFSAT